MRNQENERKKIAFIGPAGAGKSAIISELLRIEARKNNIQSSWPDFDYKADYVPTTSTEIKEEGFFKFVEVPDSEIFESQEFIDADLLVFVFPVDISKRDINHWIRKLHILLPFCHVAIVFNKMDLLNDDINTYPCSKNLEDVLKNTDISGCRFIKRDRNHIDFIISASTNKGLDALWSAISKDDVLDALWSTMISKEFNKDTVSFVASNQSTMQNQATKNNNIFSNIYMYLSNRKQLNKSIVFYGPKKSGMTKLDSSFLSSQDTYKETTETTATEKFDTYDITFHLYDTVGYVSDPNSHLTNEAEFNLTKKYISQADYLVFGFDLLSNIGEAIKRLDSIPEKCQIVIFFKRVNRFNSYPDGYENRFAVIKEQLHKKNVGEDRILKTRQGKPYFLDWNSEEFKKAITDHCLAQQKQQLKVNEQPAESGRSIFSLFCCTVCCFDDNQSSKINASFGQR